MLWSSQKVLITFYNFLKHFCLLLAIPSSRVICTHALCTIFMCLLSIRTRANTKEWVHAHTIGRLCFVHHVCIPRRPGIAFRRSSARNVFVHSKFKHASAYNLFMSRLDIYDFVQRERAGLCKRWKIRLHPFLFRSNEHIYMRIISAEQSTCWQYVHEIWRKPSQSFRTHISQAQCGAVCRSKPLMCAARMRVSRY